MNDDKPDATTASDATPERLEGQGDSLDRGTGLGASGGGLGKSTGLWSEKPARDDLKKAGANPDFDRALEE